MKSLFTKVGEIAYKTQLVFGEGALKENIILEASLGLLTAGTLLKQKSNGFYELATASGVTATAKFAVLLEDVDDSTGAHETAAAYTKGTFNAAFVKLASGTLTAADIATLANNGIVIVKTMPATGAEPSVDILRRKITYKANGGTGDDYVAYCDNGATYTVLGNDTTAFTAPATKAFSKWNTAADGTGDDYAAAASYTASADLTLYAVWA